MINKQKIVDDLCEEVHKVSRDVFNLGQNINDERKSLYNLGIVNERKQRIIGILKHLMRKPYWIQTRRYELNLQVRFEHLEEAHETKDIKKIDKCSGEFISYAVTVLNHVSRLLGTRPTKDILGRLKVEKQLKRQQLSR